jgi:1-acyl-sn-glycerol-3-phosphate acyltransferase
MKGRLQRGGWIAVYYLSWLLFGAVGLALNAVCVLLLPWPRRAALAPAVRGTIRRLFDGWLRWLHATGLIRVSWHGFDGVTLPQGAVYVANHPSLTDATFLLGRLPAAICLFKPALMRNPALGPAALMAGYVPAGSGLGLVRAASVQVARGQSLLVFPEGTRTSPGQVLNPLRAGFALIAVRARAPVQLVVVRASPGLGARGRGWWPAPTPLPAWVTLTLDRQWPYDPGRTVAELTAQVEGRIREVLNAANDGP